jgi:hypothetical protein
MSLSDKALDGAYRSTSPMQMGRLGLRFVTHQFKQMVKQGATHESDFPSQKQDHPLSR